MYLSEAVDLFEYLKTNKLNTKIGLYSNFKILSKSKRSFRLEENFLSLY